MRAIMSRALKAFHLLLARAFLIEFRPAIKRAFLQGASCMGLSRAALLEPLLDQLVQSSTDALGVETLSHLSPLLDGIERAFQDVRGIEARRE